MSDTFNILDYTDGPLLKSGQTVNYTPAGRTTLDDGGQRNGIVGSKLNAQYEILTTGQYSGTTNVTVNAIVNARSNEAVFDKVTGLMWQRTVSPSVYGTGALNLFWSDTVTNEDIFNFCDQSNISGVSGFTNWRLPNIIELESIWIMAEPNALPNTIAWPTIVGSGLWSSTTVPSNTPNAMAKLIGSGVSGAGNAKTTVRLPVLLVRNP